MQTSGAAALILILLFIALVIFGPLPAIWSVNVLFATSIGYGLAEWFAALILMGVFGSGSASKARQ
jgi:hypothetical protein